ncbi:carbohydrate ABC transporter substrate-binding protein (CUT1 family) [Actinomadura pelletieri DSM 43383]|uniref:Carbohydrate ABC transporter substrate-binding protein (CUT1 family) n=1 Tax=Actinomadura pelletieri DSM 43383 TaxID=1120940 RepID=A0A495QT61_9ACTN|nr:ABC transporter substrate-binding protein [Actinomadura pelletieri]RKS76709.1 carbohydrate ABC transporter substrate-binding protein (CUT1 family) [Actinomadura pelletieri DSM 43383]
MKIGIGSATACAAVLAGALLSGCSGDDGGVSADGTVRIVFWHGQTQIAQKALDELVAEFNRTHPKIKVESQSGGSTADQLLPKVTAALVSGSYPDISYIYGSDLASIARNRKVADLTSAVQAPGVDWNDFWPAARSAATVDGRVRAIPALTDNLAVIYNKKLFAERNVAPPKPGWSWDDFRATAKALTDPSKGTLGTAWPIADGEDVTWRLWPLVWQQGGDIVTPDRRRSRFAGPEGVRGLTVWRDMAVTDKSVYLDQDSAGARMGQLFNNGKMGMFIAGPWALADIGPAGVDYAVAPLPGFNGDNTTIGGPDNWVVMDKGSKRRKAATEFLLWLTRPAQDLRWDLATGQLPLRASASRHPSYATYKARWKLDVWIDNLPKMRTRPTLRAYPKLSQAVQEAIAAVLLGKMQPGPALDRAAKAADSALATEE